MSESENYKLVEHESAFHNDHWCIRILEGKYAGVVYQYDTISVEEGTDGGNMEVFYNLIYADIPEGLDIPDNCDIMNETTGNILLSMIDDAIANFEKEQSIDVDRTDNPAEPDTQ